MFSLKKPQVTLSLASFWSGVGVATVAHLAGRAAGITLDSAVLPVLGGVVASMVLILYPDKPLPPPPPQKGTRAKP